MIRSKKHTHKFHILSTFVLAFLLTTSFSSFGQDSKIPTNGATVTLKGEIIDMSCYMRAENMGRGKVHKKCTAYCVNQGSPMGIITQGGKLYLITFDENNRKPYNTLKSQIAEVATKNNTKVTGKIYTRMGMSSLVLESYK